MFHDEPIVMDFVGQPNDESNEVYFYFQLRNNTNDTMIFYILISFYCKFDIHEFKNSRLCLL